MTETAEEIISAGALPNTQVPDEPVAPVLEAPPEVPEVPELRYRYQPTDEHGRTIGGEQVIIYKTPDELADKLRDQNVSLVRKLREVTKKNRLGIVDDKLPENASRLPVSPKIEKKILTPEERFAISQKIADPETFEAGRDELLESAGWSALQQTVEQIQFTNRQLLARANAQSFIDSTPDFYLCEDNLKTVTDYMVKNELEPSIENFKYANSTLREAGLLLEAPIVREEAAVTPPNTVPNVEPAAPITRISNSAPPQQPSQPARVPSGLNSRTASNTGVAPNGNTLSLAEIERMPSDLYKKKLSDPQFAAAVNKLYESSAKRPVR